VIAPRNEGSMVGPTAVSTRKATSPDSARARRGRPTGVEERGMHAQGFPRNLGASPVSRESDRAGPPMTMDPGHPWMG
jgi:hypothetical protein